MEFRETRAWRLKFRILCTLYKTLRTFPVGYVTLATGVSVTRESTYRHIVAKNNGHNNAINCNSFAEDNTANEKTKINS